MKIDYDPSKDELILTIEPVKGHPNKKAGPLKLWWDNEGTLLALAITPYTQELDKFRKQANLIKLGGIWRGITLTEKEIQDAREILLNRLEEKW